MKKNNPIVEKGILAGNLYPKYTTRNPIAMRLVGRFLQDMDKLVFALNPPDIHEVGCGEGYLISRYAQQNRKLKASDFSEQVIELAGNIARTNKVNNITFKVKDVYSLVPEHDAATLVICSEVLEHLDDPALALDRLAGIAKPYLIASVPREPIWRVLNMTRGKYLRDWGNTPGHLQAWSKQGFVRFLSDRFEILQVLTPLPWTLILARVKSNGG